MRVIAEIRGAQGRPSPWDVASACWKALALAAMTAFDTRIDFLNDLSTRSALPTPADSTRAAQGGRH